MIHSRIKWLHTEEDTTTKHKTIRSQNTISEKDCRDLTKINRQRKHEGFDRSLPEVKLCRNRLKGQCCSLPKKSTREVVLRSMLFKGQTRVGRGSKCLVERSAKKVFQRSNWSRKGKSLGKGLRSRLLKGQIRAENTWRALVEVWGCACCRSLGRACWRRRGYSLRRDRRGM